MVKGSRGMTSTLIKTMRKRFIAAIAATVSLSGLLAMGYSHNEGRLNACNSGSIEDCAYVAELSGDSYKNRITNSEWQAKLKAAKEAKEKAEAKRDAQVAAVEADTKKRNAKILADQKAAEAKFKAEGWFQLSSGIYGRWCTQTCNKASVIGSSSYWLLEVWAKDRAAGDIYARINVLQNGTVVGWTNDTAYLSRGQRGVMTFTKHLPGYGSNYSAQLTEFNARG